MWEESMKEFTPGKVINASPSHTAALGGAQSG